MPSTEARTAVLEEVRLIIVEAQRDGGTVRADGIARIVASSYPSSGLNSREIADRIKAAAAAAGVPVEPGGIAWAASGPPAKHSSGAFDRRSDTHGA